MQHAIDSDFLIASFLKLESDVCCHLQVAPSGESYGGNRRPGRK